MKPKKKPTKDVTEAKPEQKTKAKKKPEPKLPQKVTEKPDAASAFVYRGLTQLLGIVVNGENVKSISYSVSGDQLQLSLGVHSVRLTPDQLKLLGYDAKGFAVWLTTKGAKRAKPTKPTKPTSNSTGKV